MEDGVRPLYCTLRPLYCMHAVRQLYCTLKRLRIQGHSSVTCHTATHCNALQYNAIYLYSTLEPLTMQKRGSVTSAYACVAVCCSVLQCVAVSCSTLQCAIDLSRERKGDMLYRE